MKVKADYFGKVSITCNGRYNENTEYERLCLIHDGNYASYISRKKTPAGTPLTDETYWQPIASFKEDLVIDYQEFQANILDRIAKLQVRLAQSRLVVANDEEREALTYEEVAPGAAVYVLETKRTYICDSIRLKDNVKTWHLAGDSLLGSHLFGEFNGQYPEGIAERAIGDETGLNIHENYLTKEQVVNYTAAVVRKYLIDNALNILDGQITPAMLSESVKQLLGNKNIVNLADEEDLTSVNNTLKFADKAYNTAQYSGMARKFLRKNMIDGVNVLTQEMINEPNTIYILQYDYCLNGETITLPDNSIILWLGGKLYDGHLNINKARIIGVYCFDDMFDAETLTTDEDWAVGQIIYMGDTNYYMYWNGEKWLYIGVDPSITNIIGDISYVSDFEYFANNIAGQLPVEEFTKTQITIEPNKYYLCTGKLNSLTILRTGDWFVKRSYKIFKNGTSKTITKTYVNHYWIDVCLTATDNITLPTGVNWHDDIEPDTPGHYQISIVNKIASWVFVDTCDETTPPPPPVETQVLAVNPTTLVFPWGGGNKTVTINSSLLGGTITNNDNLVTIDKTTFDVGTTKLTVTADENDSYSMRQLGTLTVKDTDGNTKTVTMKQNAKPEEPDDDEVQQLSISPETLVLPADGSGRDITVVSTLLAGALSVSNEDIDLYTSYFSAGTTTIEVTCPANPSTARRTLGTIKAEDSEGNKVTCLVEQLGSEADPDIENELSISPTSIELDADGTAQSATITSTLLGGTISADSGIHIDKSSFSAGITSINISADVNTSTSSRNLGSVTATDADGNEVTCTVTQKGVDAPAEVCPVALYSDDLDGDNLEIGDTLNVKFYTDSEDDVTSNVTATVANSSVISYSNGTITALAAGSSSVTFSYKKGDCNEVKITTQIVVNAPAPAEDELTLQIFVDSSYGDGVYLNHVDRETSASGLEVVESYTGDNRDIFYAKVKVSGNVNIVGNAYFTDPAWENGDPDFKIRISAGSASDEGVGYASVTTPSGYTISASAIPNRQSS